MAKRLSLGYRYKMVNVHTHTSLKLLHLIYQLRSFFTFKRMCCFMVIHKCIKCQLHVKHVTVQ